MSRLMGVSFKDLALVLGGTFGIPLLAAVFYRLYGTLFCFFSIFSVRDAIFI